jgi:antirestriction protein ArdC
MDKITEFCQPIADAIISGLEKVQADGCKWEMPWAAPKNRPYNWLTKEPYHGMNTFILAACQYNKGYRHPYWLTFKQMKTVESQFNADTGFTDEVHLTNKGAKSTRCLKVDRYPRKGYKKVSPTQYISPAGKSCGPDEGESFYSNVFNLFNVDQISGWPDGMWPDPIQSDHIEPSYDPCIGWWRAAGSQLPPLERRDYAAYSPPHDLVYMPDLAEFTEESQYWATLLHEFSHATSHKKRVGRDVKTRAEIKAYAVEELIAEFSASYLTAFFGIEGDLQHREYIGSYAEVLKNDPTIIRTCASEADKAATWLLKAGAMDWHNPFKTNEEIAA